MKDRVTVSESERVSGEQKEKHPKGLAIFW